MAEEDLLFAKNRHLFGGIEPSTMKQFTIENKDGKVTINAILPDNTVINGQTLCVVAGAVIRRGKADYPKNEFDGEEIVTITSSGVFIDDTADVANAYSYSAFPFTKQGVYSHNKKNRAMYNEPSNMVVFKGKSRYDSAQKKVYVDITYELPSGVSGAKIVRKSSGYPTDENDGTLVLDAKSNGIYSDGDVLEDTTYYYAAFPYTANGFYNRNPKNRFEVMPRAFKFFYGYDLNENDPDPNTRVSYPEDVQNFGYTPIRVTGNSFNSGSWNLTPGFDFVPRPCMLGYNGTVAYYLDPNDYTKKLNGQPSDIRNKNYKGNAMIEWPLMYVKRWKTGNIYHFRCCDMRLDPEYTAYNYYDKNLNFKQHFYTAIYQASWDKTNIRSLSSAETWTMGDTKITYGNYRNYLKNMGSGWDSTMVSDYALLSDLVTMIGKSTNTQNVFGYGAIGDSDWSRWSGAGDNLGYFGTRKGNATINGHDYHNTVKVFGIDSLWGDRSIYLLGLMILNGNLLIKNGYGTFDGTSVSDFNNTGKGYIKMGTVNSINSRAYVKLTGTKYGRYILNPFVTGSSNTYDCDSAFLAIGDSKDVKLIIVLGGYNAGLGVGMYHTDFSSLYSTVNTTLGGFRLSYR